MNHERTRITQQIGRRSERTAGVDRRIVGRRDHQQNIDRADSDLESGAEKIFGFTAAEAIGKSITIIIPPDRYDEEKMILSRLNRGERIEHYETIRMGKGGQRIDISVTISPLRDSSGTVIGASKVARDVTARKQAETDLQLVHDMSMRLAATLDLQVILDETLRTAVSIDGTTMGLLSLYMPETKTHSRSGQRGL